jgi:hypothetical protein
MTVAIKDLMSDAEYLVDVTDAELRQVNGGYAAAIVNQTNNPGLAFQTAALVFNRSVFEPDLITRQVQLGVPSNLVSFGVNLALAQGGGVYTPFVTGQKLGG